MPTPETSTQPKQPEQFGPWAGSLPKQEGQSWLDLGKSPEANRNDLAEQERRERQTGALLSATQLARERYAPQATDETDEDGHVPIN